MKAFGSINKIAVAPVEEIRALGINQTTAQLIKVSLQGQAEVKKGSSHD